MTKLRFTMQAVTLSVFMLALASVAQAQASRTWVSGVGDDVNPCSRTAPCKTFAGAISKTATNGYINALDPGGFGALTITKSITVDGTGQLAGVLNSLVNAINVNFDSFAGTDTRKKVVLRNFNMEGFNNGTRGVRITGGVTVSGGTVTIENVWIEGNFGSPGTGIEDVRSNGGELIVDGAQIRNMGGNGILVNPASGSVPIQLVVTNTRVTNCAFGIAISKAAKATVYNSVVSHNTSAGLHVDNAGGTGTTEMEANHCVIASNGTGVEATTANSRLNVGSSTFLNNTTLFSALGGGVVGSYGNNQTNGVVLGTAVTPR